VKFFLFTQVSGLFMLMAILSLYMLHGRAGGGYSFDLAALLHTPMAAATQTWLMLGFLAAFAVKLPAIPVHTWLPDAHTEAPTAGSIILAGLLLKTGAFGLLRFALPLFPVAAAQIAPIALVIGVVGVLYGAIQAFGQRDLKRMVAYTSASHMGFVLLGIFSGNALAMQGAVLEMLCHGLATGALFVVAGILQERLGTRDMRQMGGFWAGAPRLGGAALFFALASLGLPGLGNFVAEFLILLGLFQGHVVAAAVATVGLVAATLYSLWMMQRVFFGQPSQPLPADLRRGEAAILAAMGLALVWLGLWPGTVLSISQPAVAQVMQRMAAPQGGGATAPASVQDQARAPLRAEVRP
jgi:NADH-quinone oxidoreductase subunit M